ncbi:MAG: hypothetical protein NTY50_01765 [Methylobacter sp.]|nr:hypothetical protein [Methylobacter sp.]
MQKKRLPANMPTSGLGRRHYCRLPAIWIFSCFIQNAVYAAEALLIENNTPFANASGISATYSRHGAIDQNNEFFQSLGTNDRSCSTCHRPEEGWSITPKSLQRRFYTSGGNEPVFRANDGANSPKANVSSIKARRKAYSLLLNKGLIRIAIKIPATAEFELVEVSDPYGFVTKNDIAPAFELSLFRRPLPATNLKFLSAVMWDGRETVSGRSIHYDLTQQADNATTGHAQGHSLSSKQRQHIVDFESALFTAQVYDNDARSLTVAGVKGGPVKLSKQRFYKGINDVLGDSKTGLPSDSKVFSLYDAWDDLIVTAPTDIRAAIARGQHLFNTKPLTISGVAGINDAPEFGNADIVTGTCSTCHNSPNAGSHSTGKFLNIGIGDDGQRTPDMPLYTLRNKTTGELQKTTDPGRGAITGEWSDVGRFKVPTLRGLAARAPYFHNGMATELGNVLDFYDRRFQIGLNNRERLDLILFLRTL